MFITNKGPAFPASPGISVSAASASSASNTYRKEAHSLGVPKATFVKLWRNYSHTGRCRGRVATFAGDLITALEKPGGFILEHAEVGPTDAWQFGSGEMLAHTKTNDTQPDFKGHLTKADKSLVWDVAAWWKMKNINTEVYLSVTLTPRRQPFRAAAT